MNHINIDTTPSILRPEFPDRDGDAIRNELNSIYTQLKALPPGTVFTDAEKIRVRRCLAALMAEAIACVASNLLADINDTRNNDDAYSDGEFLEFGRAGGENLSSLSGFNKQITICSIILQGISKDEILATAGDPAAREALVNKVINFARKPS
jgi:hypothetical protein